MENCPAIVFNRIKRAAAGENGAPLAPLIGLLRRTLGPRGGVGQREDGRDAAGADEGVGPVSAQRIHQVLWQQVNACLFGLGFHHGPR